MRTNSPLLIATFLILAGTSGLALAQGTAKPAGSSKSATPSKPAAPAVAAAAQAAAGAPSKEQVDDAAFEMHVLISAMQSDKVEAPAKDALFECLYSNNFAKISDAIAKVVAQNADKIAKRNPEQILNVMVGICGYRPKEPAADAKPGAPAPAVLPAPAKVAPAAPAKPSTTQGR